MKDSTKVKKVASWAAFLLALLMIVGLVPLLSTVEVRAADINVYDQNSFWGAQGGGDRTVKVTQDFETAWQLGNTWGTLTVDGQGHTITGLNGISPFTISGGKLILKDITIVVCRGSAIQSVSGASSIEIDGSKGNGVTIIADHLIQSWSSSGVIKGTGTGIAFTFAEDDIIWGTPNPAVTPTGFSPSMFEHFDLKREKCGYPEVKPVITVTAMSDSKQYDGTLLFNAGYNVDGENNLKPGHKLEASTSGAQTIPGTTPNTMIAKIVNGSGKDVSGQYVLNKIPGTLTVINRKITVTADSDSKTYDGKPLEKNSATAEPLATGHTLASVEVTGQRTEVGSSANVAQNARVKNADKVDVTAYHDITYEDGTLTVTLCPITVTADSASKTYDGRPLRENSASATGLPEGHKLASVRVFGQQTDVGKSWNVARQAVIRDAEGNVVTKNFAITYKRGWLSVGKRTLHITADSASKTYDGEALTEEGVKVWGLVRGQRLDSVIVTGSQTDAGWSSNVPSDAVIKSFRRDVTSNYKILYHNGKLRVNKRLVTITALDASKEYDGESLFRHEASAVNLVDGHYLASADYYGQRTWVGSRSNVVRNARINDADDNDVTDNYWFKYVDGLLQVTPKALVVRADSASREYDGTPLTAEGATAEGLVDGHVLDSFLVTGTITNFGTEPNLVSDAVIKDGDKIVSWNYDISYEPGQLEILAKDAVITVAGVSKTFEEEDPVFTGSVEGLIEKDDLGAISYYRSNDDEAVGKYPAVLDALFTDNPNYRVLVNKGDFEILEPASIVAGDEDIKKGDGGGGIVKGDEDTKTPVTGELRNYVFLGGLMVALGLIAVVLGKQGLKVNKDS